MNDALESLNRLRAGNDRYINNTSNSPVDHQTRRSELAGGQKPFAIILGCADSRAPAELIFDQGLGDLFVIRVAGNIAAPTQVGSVEFAASKFAVPLVVVLGHTHCGAIVATVDALQHPAAKSSDHSIHSIVDCVGPAIEHLLPGAADKTQNDLIKEATKANINACVKQLSLESPLLKQRIGDDQLKVVGALYDIETGRVEFYD